MKNNLTITTVPIIDLNPAPYNPRKWNEEQKAQLTESIKTFGLVDPIIVNGTKERKNIIIGGHFRLHIAKQLGYAEVPVVYLDIPDEARERELNLRLNKNSGEWDFEKLQAFDIEDLLTIGFNNDDLTKIWDDALEIEDDHFDTKEELKAIEEVTLKKGDLYALGKHRLLCGDSTDLQNITTLTQGLKPSMVYCDPPYNIGLSYNGGIGGKKHYGGTTNDSKSDDEYRAFLRATMQNALTVCGDNVHIFYWCDCNAIGLIQELYKEFNVTPRRVVLWIKNNANITPQIAFSKVYEPCVYGTVGAPYLAERTEQLTEILNKEIGTGNRSIEDIADMLDIWLEKRLPADSYNHPTEKPPTLHEKPLRRCTKPGDIVLDLFGGSGSTLAACEQLNRTALLCEIEPIFCQLILHRYEQLTGQTPVKLASGR